MKKKNILFVINELKGAGAQRVVITLANALVSLGHRVEVILMYNYIDYPIDKLNFNIHIICKKKSQNFLLKLITFPWKYNFFFPWIYKNFSKIVKELNIQFDLCISNLWESDVIIKQEKLPNTYHCIHNSPTIIAQNNLKYLKPISFKLFFKRLIFSTISKNFPFENSPKNINPFYKNTNLIAVSEGVKKNLLESGIEPKTLQTIYNPFNFANIRQQAQAYQVEEQDYIIHVGRLDSLQKRHDVLISAYKKSDIKQKLLLLGNGGYAKTNKKIHQLVKELNLQDKVIFKGFIANPYPYIRQAKLLVLSSDYEGLPMVLIEALILKIPVVSTDCVSGPSEILIDELSNFLSPIGDITALANNIKKAIDHPVNITEKYITKFDDVKIAKQYLQLAET